MTGSYFIKEGYICNKIPKTMDRVSNDVYWNKARIHASRYYQYHVYNYASQIIKDYSLNSLIDVGCGSAVKLKSLKQSHPDLLITGIDQENAIFFCKETYDFGRWFSDDFENPKGVSPKDRAELIICADVIEHVNDPNKLLTYIRSLTKEGGYIIISTPERDYIRGKHCMTCPQSQHIREWNMKEFSQYLQSQNFSILKHFCVPAYKPSLGKDFIKQDIARLIKGFPKANNQVILLQVR